MRRLWAIISLLAIVGALALAAGCVDSNPEEAQTPSGATTVQNTALQTDSSGKTIAAPPSNAPPSTGGGQTGGQPPAGMGDAAAGKTFFSGTCGGCHMNNGTAAGGVGPKLQGLGLTAQRIHDQVVNGGGGMPPGLASGKDLDNVVAYVLSIQ